MGEGAQSQPMILFLQCSLYLLCPNPPIIATVGAAISINKVLVMLVVRSLGMACLVKKYICLCTRPVVRLLFTRDSKSTDI